MKISPGIRKNKPLYYGALVQMIYASIEFVDSLAIPLIALNILPNFYLILPMANAELSLLLTNEPFWFIPIFWFFTSFRIASGYWILQNKAKGFWMAMFISGITLIAVFFLLPFSVIDIIGTGIVVFLLFMGYFKDQPIIKQESSQE
jgi:quinol-cytochrome oxidoreductase complex cytochrome b subunit